MTYLVLLTFLFTLILCETTFAEETEQSFQRTDTHLDLMTEEEICKEIRTPCMEAIQGAIFPLKQENLEEGAAAIARGQRGLEYLKTLRIFARKKQGQEVWWNMEMGRILSDRDMKGCEEIVKKCGTPHYLITTPTNVLELDSK